MKTVEMNRFETLCVPDAEPRCSKMASYENSGWVTIGRMGSTGSISLYKEDWSALVVFVGELDAHMKANSVGAYTPDEEGVK